MSTLPLLRPECEPLTKSICTIAIVGDRVNLSLPERHEKFLRIVKGRDFIWDFPNWFRRKTFMTPSLEDLAAETAVELVGEGFVVDLKDPTAHAKAVAGEYEEEVPNWVYVGGGDFEGLCIIKWARRFDLYAEARSLPGSKYKSGVVTVPLSSIDAVADFADKHGFRMSESFKAKLDAHMTGISTAVVLKKKPTPNVPSAEKPATPETFFVDESLLDDV